MPYYTLTALSLIDNQPIAVLGPIDEEQCMDVLRRSNNVMIIKRIPVTCDIEPVLTETLFGYSVTLRDDTGMPIRSRMCADEAAASVLAAEWEAA